MASEAQPGPEAFGGRSDGGSECLDRMSAGIYERAVRFHEHQRWLSPAAVREFRPEIADLKDTDQSYCPVYMSLFKSRRPW